MNINAIRTISLIAAFISVALLISCGNGGRSGVPITLPDIDISGSELGIVSLPDNVDQLFRDKNVTASDL